MEAGRLWAESGVGRRFHSCTSGHPEEDTFGVRQYLSFHVTARLLAVINVCSNTLQFVAGGRTVAAEHRDISSKKLLREATVASPGPIPLCKVSCPLALRSLEFIH